MLTDAQIRGAKPREKAYKLGDGGGLWLLVTPAGGRLWRLRFTWRGIEKMLGLGRYPEVPLALARERRDEARRQLARGIDPSDVRRAEKLARADTFGAVAEEWLKRQKYSAVTRQKAEWITTELLAPLARKPVASISAAEALEVLRRIEKRGQHESAHRARQKLSQVLRYAISTSRATADVTIGLRGALTPVETVSRAAITSMHEFGQLVAALDTYQNFVTRQFLRILARVVTRPSELRLARWSDLQGDRLIIPAERMKMRHEHVVPIAPPVFAMFEELRAMTGEKAFMFEGLRPGRPITDAVPSLALKALGYESSIHTAHGFRASFSTMMHDQGADTAVIELCLAHVDRNSVRAIYNRSQRIDERTALMSQWATLCDLLALGQKQPGDS